MKSRTEIISELRDISVRMISLGVDIEYLAGFGSELAEKGREMIGAGQIAAQWADQIEAKDAQK